MDTGARLPTSQAIGKKICGSGCFGIFNNLLTLKVYDVGGHAYMNIGDIII